MDMTKEVTKHNNAVLVDSHNNLTEQFAKWLYEASQGYHLVSKERIAKKIQSLDPERYDVEDLYQKDFSSWIAKTRIYLETQKNCTLFNVPGMGWRISTKKETASYYGRCVWKTAAWAERTMRLQAITDPKDIPEVMREIVAKMEKQVDKLGGHHKRYLKVFVDAMRKQAESTNGQKQIAR